MKLIYSIVYGSRCYGTATIDSDWDYRKITLPTVNEMLAFHRPEAKEEKTADGDCLTMPLHQFMQLAAKGNPSVIEWLFVGSDCIREMTPEGKAVRDNRLLFLSKEIGYRFRGYAVSEFSKLTKLTEKTGEKRKGVILEHGYSPKNAMNAFRLIGEATELLTTGGLVMPLKEHAWLLKIKKAEFRFEDINRMYWEHVAKLDEAIESTKLPEKPRMKDIERLFIDITTGKYYDGL